MTLPDTTAQLIEEVQRLGNVSTAQDKALRDISMFARFARKAFANDHLNLVDLKLQHIQETLILCGIPQVDLDGFPEAQP